MQFEPVIGLEVHAQLATHTKLFCSCHYEYGAAPNTQTCPVCLGMPGVLPVLNRQAVEYAIKMGLATDCTIRPFSRFARKNYFYPDLPKGYQISQYDEPLCYDGGVDIEYDDGEIKRIGLTRIHLEEDAGKSIHTKSGGTRVDFNRCGVPLIEIVSEPDIRSPEEARAYLNKLKQILLYLGVSDCNMEEGSLRCDANISIRPVGQEEFGTKTEMKNMNSFRGVERALQYEIERQTEVLESDGTITQDTLLWNETENRAERMRTKEEAEDYRYFPEPDLLPLEVSEEWLTDIESNMPELPGEKRQRFIDSYGLRDYDAGVLTDNRAVAAYFEDVAKESGEAQLAAKWVMGEVLRVLKDQSIAMEELSLEPRRFAGLLERVADKTVNNTVAKQIFDDMLNSAKTADEIIEEQGLKQVSDTSELETIVEGVIEANPDEYEKYKNGNPQLMGFFMGQVMQETQGKANPQKVKEILGEKLGKPE
ncbi:MAG: Asp-tRNA(Asn)/Glu-tRNA(Gln) amidotransferase subunit GatB [Candidatus Marinimicrobia bacterium]|nr:Asp-tRNA(Asn)/Glu-tRNA(Gln) amidotransferase subunit GatB [Candidatus Neomarinimicrobiota bacterium]MCF7828938.1 Asp-tRNA(Asn)/Glu-tRNA(Gln) amidotransferase subunit GatB [Candidatus Neomarinimicrobiota bacterium]MCF7879898.1 Asp-tRNA(Asn)/Glu-tRNA(Gln) amidotransferase subunit GatB [Candidatus Neomarinimicrobiota bacterium]